SPLPLRTWWQSVMQRTWQRSSVLPELTTIAGGSSVSSRNATNSEVPLGVLSFHGWSLVPSTDLPLPAIRIPRLQSLSPRRGFLGFASGGDERKDRHRSISTIRRLQVTEHMEKIRSSEGSSRAPGFPKVALRWPAFPSRPSPNPPV